MTRVFLYLRVSTASQVDGDGFPRQEAACRSLAESKGWTVSRVFKEQVSGSDEFSDRPLMNEAIALCGDVTGVKVLVVERADRVARDLCVAELFYRACRKGGIQVFAADSGEELVHAESDPTRVLVRQLLGGLAQWDKAMLVKKLQSGRRRKKAETGLPCGGRRPYGFRPGEWRGMRVILRMHDMGFHVPHIEKTMRRLCRRRPDKFLMPFAPHRRVKAFWWSEETIKSLIRWWAPRVDRDKNLIGRELPEVLKTHFGET